MTPILAVLVQLLLEYFLLFNSDIVNYMWKTDERGGRGAESIVLLIFALCRCFNCWWVRVCGLGQIVLFRAS